MRVEQCPMKIAFIYFFLFQCQLHIQNVYLPPKCRTQKVSCKYESDLQSCTKNYCNQMLVFFHSNYCKVKYRDKMFNNFVYMAWREKIVSDHIVQKQNDSLPHQREVISLPPSLPPSLPSCHGIHSTRGCCSYQHNLLDNYKGILK